MVLLSAFSLMTSLQWQPRDWSSGQVLLPVGSSSQARLAKLRAPISRFIGAAHHGIPVTYHDFINQNQPLIPKILQFQTWKREPCHHMSPNTAPGTLRKLMKGKTSLTRPISGFTAHGRLMRPLNTCHGMLRQWGTFKDPKAGQWVNVGGC